MRIFGLSEPVLVRSACSVFVTTVRTVSVELSSGCFGESEEEEEDVDGEEADSVWRSVVGMSTFSK